MGEDYTPTTEQVRFAFIDREDFEAQVGGVERPTDEESGAAFDRWLAFERAQAWDEGWAERHHHDERAGLPAPGNPYREADDARRRRADAEERGNDG